MTDMNHSPHHRHLLALLANRANRAKASRPATLLLAACLSGCSLIPALPKFDAQLPGQWTAEQASATALSKPLAWADYFPDPRLQTLIREALAHNRDARVAYLNVVQAQSLLTVQRADQWPTLNAALNATRQPASSPPYDLGTVATAGLSLTAFEIDVFGRVRALSEAAQAQWLSSVGSQRTVQISLVSAVASSYYSLWADRWQLALAQQTLATRESSLKLQQLRYDSGVLNELDWRSAQAQVEAAKVSRAQAQRQWQQSLNAMAVLLGRVVPPEALPPVPDMPAASAQADANTQAPQAHALVPLDGAALWPVLSELPVGLPSEVLYKRPDVVAAEQLLVAANANVGAARAARFPRISLTASAGVASDALSDLFTDGRGVWSLAGNLTAPLLDAGRSRANVDVSIARRDTALAQYEKALQVAFREVSDALVARSTWAEQAQAQQAQAQAEAQRFKLSALRYTSGVASQLDLLDAQRSLFASQQALIAAQLARQQAHIAVFKALGGGLD